jgi:hypothetical protein
MRTLPFATRLLLGWLVLVTLAPALVGVAEALGLYPAGMLPLALLGAVLAALLGLLIFAPPRSASTGAWLKQLRERLVPNVSPSPQSPRQEQ